MSESVVLRRPFESAAGIPCAMVLTVSFALSSVTMLGCHRRSQKIPRPWRLRRSARTTRLRRTLQHHSSAQKIAPDAAASIASRTQRPWRSRAAPLLGCGI